MPDGGINEFSEHSRAIEFLANETHMPVEQIAKLYGREHSKLAVDARIKDYLPVLAIRKVREILKLRSILLSTLTQRSSDQTSNSFG
jgi:Protein of unknown function (DUF3562)